MLPRPPQCMQACLYDLPLKSGCLPCCVHGGKRTPDLSLHHLQVMYFFALQAHG